MQRYLELLRREPHFRFLWLASVVSLFGDWFNTIASVILVNRYTDSNVAVGALFIARSLPPFLLGPVAGVAADRFSRKQILIITDITRAVVVLGLLLVDRPERAWLIYALTIAQFTISAFFEPARSAILPSLVSGEKDLLTANTLSSATWSAMLTLGAALGGVFAAVFGVKTALIVDAVTFLFSALLVLQVQPRPRGEDAPEKQSGWLDFVDGLRFVRQRPRLGMLATVKSMGQLGSPDIMIAIFAAQVFVLGEDGALSLGLLYAFAGLGAVLGPFLANAFGSESIPYLRRAIGVGFVFIVAGWLLFGLAPVFPLALLAMTIRHMGGSVNWTYSSVLLQLQVPDRYLGRVFALDFGLFTLAAAASVWATGFILDRVAVSAQMFAVWLAITSLLPVVFWGAFLRRTE